jgi:hypothetical protein
MAGVNKRVAVSGELQRQYAEQAAETQRLLTDVSAQLADLTGTPRTCNASSRTPNDRPQRPLTTSLQAVDASAIASTYEMWPRSTIATSWW